MELMITRPLVLPETPLALGELEAVVQAWGQALQREALAAAWAAQAADRAAVACPQCQSPDWRPAGRKVRQIETVFGPVGLPRQRRCCRACGRHYQPDDAALAAELGRGRLSARLREVVALCGASWPYRQAADVLGRLRGVPLAAETVRAIVGRVGAAVAAAQARDAVAACAPPASAPAAGGAGPDRIEVELDGAWVRAHDNPHGLEVKVGVVHAGSALVGRTRRRLQQRRYAATAHGVAEFGPVLTLAIDRLDGFAAGSQTLLGDGAAWIWRLGDDLLPTATHVLDRWHLTQARRKALRAALPDKAERAPWSARLETALETGDVPAALAALAELRPVAAHPALDDFADYLRTLAPRIPNYAARRDAGARIGSGGIEKGVDVVVNRRLKGRRGMRWWRDRIDGMVALRVSLLNDEWSRYVPAALQSRP